MPKKNDARLQRGEKLLKKMGRQGLLQSQKKSYPDLYDMTVGHLFGDVWTRGHLSLRERQLVTLAANIALVFAILAPTCAGVWLTLPSLEYLVVPAQFRGYFSSYYTLLLGGFFAFGMINWAINPIFQIDKRTAPIIIAAPPASRSLP